MVSKLSVTEGLRLVIMRAKKSMAQVCRELGMGTPANLTNMILNGGVKMRVGARIAENCGYQLMLVPESEVEKVENGIVIKGDLE